MNLNKVILIGRISQQINTFKSKTGFSYVRFNLAVTRDSYGPERNDVTDFIPVVAFGNNAVFVSRYFNKGDLVSIVGSIQMSQYTTKNGDIANSATIVVDQIKSLEPLNVTQARADKNGNNMTNEPIQEPTFYQEQKNDNSSESENDKTDNPWELDL